MSIYTRHLAIENDARDNWQHLKSLVWGVLSKGREQAPSLIAKLLGVEWPRLKLPSFSESLRKMLGDMTYLPRDVPVPLGSHRSVWRKEATLRAPAGGTASSLLNSKLKSISHFKCVIHRALAYSIWINSVILVLYYFSFIYQIVSLTQPNTTVMGSG